MKRFALVSCVGILAFASARAQEFSRFTADFGGGYTAPAGATGDYLGWGWNIRGGAGINFSSHLGTMLNIGYDSMGINTPTAIDIGVPGGQVHAFHATIDPVVHLTPRGRTDFYLTGGGGLFHRFQEFTEPVGTTSNAYIPSLGLYPGAGGGNPLIAQYSVNRPGFDVGGGVAMRAFGHGKFFVEARWDHVFVGGGHFDYLPVSFGFRW